MELIPSGALAQPIDRPPDGRSCGKPALEACFAREVDERQTDDDRQQPLPWRHQHHQAGQQQHDADQVLDHENERPQ